MISRRWPPHPVFGRFGGLGITWFSHQPFLYVAANWPRATFKFRTRIKSKTGPTVYARIYDVTAAAEVTQVSTASASFTFLTSATMTFVNNHEYQFELGKTGVNEGTSTGYWVFLV